MKATVTITRASDDTFRIVVRDEASGIRFVGDLLAQRERDEK